MDVWIIFKRHTSRLTGEPRPWFVAKDGSADAMYADESEAKSRYDRLVADEKEFRKSLRKPLTADDAFTILTDYRLCKQTLSIVEE